MLSFRTRLMLVLWKNLGNNFDSSIPFIREVLDLFVCVDLSVSVLDGWTLYVSIFAFTILVNILLKPLDDFRFVPVVLSLL